MERQNLVTSKYLGATGTKGARIVARDREGSCTVNYNYAMSNFDNHHAAVLNLTTRRGLKYCRAYAESHDDTGYVWLFELA